MARFCYVALGLSLGLLIAAPAQAGLLGASVNVSAHYPDEATVYDAGPNTSVSGAIEYPMGTFATYNPSWEIDITDTQITVSDVAGTGFPYGGAFFNGWVLTILAGPNILSAAPDAASQFDPGISIVNGDHLFLNYSGVDGPPFGTSIINITTVPEPASLALLGLGMAGIGAGRRKQAE